MKHFALSLEHISGTVQCGTMLCCSAAPPILPRNVFAAFSTVLAGSGRTKCHPKLQWLKILSFTLIAQLLKALANPNIHYSSAVCGNTAGAVRYLRRTVKYCSVGSVRWLTLCACHTPEAELLLFVVTGTVTGYSHQHCWQTAALVTVCPVHTNICTALPHPGRRLQCSQLRCLCTVLSQSACSSLRNGKGWLFQKNGSPSSLSQFICTFSQPTTC